MPQKGLSMRNIREVLRLRIGQGLSSREVARSCNISPSTVLEYARRAAEEAADHLGFAGAKERLAVAFKDLGDAAAGGAGDFLVGIQKGHRQLPRQGGADRGLARAHHPDHDNRLSKLHVPTRFTRQRAKACPWANNRHSMA